MSGDDLVELEVAFEHATAAAVLVDYDGDTYWLPRKHVQCDTDFESCERREMIDIEIPEWLAYEKGMI